MHRSVLLVALGVAAPALAQWAGQVHSYSPGVGVAPGYDNPARALGEPTRFTGAVAGFPGCVTPFNPAFEATELVSIGAGGSLVVRFDTPITDNPMHAFGIDLIVFGNTGYIDSAWPGGVWGGVFGEGAGAIDVSADGSDWRPVAPLADAPYPTLGFSDLADPYATSPGLVPSDFTRPVNPAFQPAPGTTFADVVAAYNGSGGGTGVDLAGTGLSSISYVRVRNLGGSGTVDIDALAAVSIPAPGGLAALFPLALGARRRRR